MITKSNVKKFQETQSTINLIDITIDYCEIAFKNPEYIKKNIERYINYLFEMNIISNELIKPIKKSFYIENYFLLSVRLTDLRKEIIKIQKNIIE